jgi:hypothetical protein
VTRRNCGCYVEAKNTRLGNYILGTWLTNKSLNILWSPYVHLCVTLTLWYLVIFSVIMLVNRRVSCSLEEVYWRFEGIYFLHLHGERLTQASLLRNIGKLCQATRCHIRKYNILHNHNFIGRNTTASAPLRVSLFCYLFSSLHCSIKLRCACPLLGCLVFILQT